MKILITADTHFGAEPAVSSIVKASLIEQAEKNPEIELVIIAGDIAEVSHNHILHREFFRFLKKTFSKAQICVCLGNHDIWVTSLHKDSYQILTEILPKLAEEQGIILLEGDKVLEMPGFSVVGTLGHYDYSLATLTEENSEITEEHYQSKIPPGRTTHVWGDYRIEWDFTDKQACALILENFEKGLKKAVARNLPILSISHSVPFNEVNAWFDKDIEWRKFFNAFAGTKELGEIHFRNNKDKLIKYQISGHTHLPARIKKQGIEFINIGSATSKLKFLLLDFVENEFRELSWLQHQD